MSTIWVLHHIENTDTLHHGKDCMKKFCSLLRKYSKNRTDFEKKMCYC